VNLLFVAAALATISIPNPGAAGVGALSPRIESPSQSPSSSIGSRRRTRASKRTYEEFQVAAGTYLPIELRSVLSSNTSQPGDQVEGRLLRAVTVDDVELIPAGATVLGSVSHAEAADSRSRGRLAFSFHVIQHPETGSRAMVTTRALSFESDRPLRGKPLPEIRLEKGTETPAVLLAPLLVRLPLTTDRR
jgi:hypothetical protein